MNAKPIPEMSRIAAKPQEAGLSDYEELKTSALEPVPGPLLYLDQVVPREELQSQSNKASVPETSVREPYTADVLSFDPVVMPKPLPVERERFIALQSWEGKVLGVEKDCFTARLIDEMGSEPDQEVEVPIDEISYPDRPLVQPGATFYWDIGYSEDKSRQRTRASLIRFRRLPAWTKKELDKIKEQAEELGRSSGWE